MQTWSYDEHIRRLSRTNAIGIWGKSYCCGWQEWKEEELDNTLGCELLKEGKRILRKVCARC